MKKTPKKLAIIPNTLYNAVGAALNVIEKAQRFDLTDEQDDQLQIAHEELDNLFTSLPEYNE
jgi:uncharacterized protein (DUF1778 family)